MCSWARPPTNTVFALPPPPPPPPPPPAGALCARDVSGAAAGAAAAAADLRTAGLTCGTGRMSGNDESETKEGWICQRWKHGGKQQVELRQSMFER